MADKKKDKKGRVLKEGEYQMPDGRYRYRYNDENGKRQAVYSWKLVSTDRVPKGKKDDLSLREKEEQIIIDKHDGISTAPDKVTLNDIWQKYIEGKTELKDSTRNNYKYMYKQFVFDDIGRRKVSDIKYSDIKAFYNRLQKEKGLKPNTIENVNTILHPTFTLAVRDGYIRSNPTDGVMGEIKKSNAWEKPKRHALTIEEQEAFVSFLKESDMYNHWLPLFTFFLGTGCRVGEGIGLRWKDIDFKNRTININHNMIYRQNDEGICEMHITTPKTSAGCRTIPMLDEVYKALMIERSRQMEAGHTFSNCEVDGYTGFIFTNRFGYVHNPQTINRAIERIIKACNEQEQEKAKKEGRKPVQIRHFSIHNLRHTFCTRFCENESNIKVIQEIMGHSDITTTMNIYAEATEDKKKESFENLQGKIKIG